MLLSFCNFCFVQKLYLGVLEQRGGVWYSRRSCTPEVRCTYLNWINSIPTLFLTSCVTLEKLLTSLFCFVFNFLFSELFWRPNTSQYFINFNTLLKFNVLLTDFLFGFPRAEKNAFSILDDQVFLCVFLFDCLFGWLFCFVLFCLSLSKNFYCTARSRFSCIFYKFWSWKKITFTTFHARTPMLATASLGSWTGSSCTVRSRGQHAFSVNSQIADIFGFASYTVSDKTTPFWYRSMKATINDT